MYWNIIMSTGIVIEVHLPGQDNDKIQRLIYNCKEKCRLWVVKNLQDKTFFINVNRIEYIEQSDNYGR